MLRIGLVEPGRIARRTRNAIEVNSRDVRMLVAGRDLHQETLNFFCDTYGVGSKFADIGDILRLRSRFHRGDIS